METPGRELIVVAKELASHAEIDSPVRTDKLPGIRFKVPLD